MDGNENRNGDLSAQIYHSTQYCQLVIPVDAPEGRKQIHGTEPSQSRLTVNMYCMSVPVRINDIPGMLLYHNAK